MASHVDSFCYSFICRAEDFFHSTIVFTMEDDVTALVVDNGSIMCKAGFVGDDEPMLAMKPKVNEVFLH